ncbi:T9SS type A sorting domain-containing protein [Flavobacterium sp.]|uniref:T9SS type A sorting domain-containing protein n=1 Tax=Flavobacterium sp. TaxID=239 RepID=UPI003D0D5806
MKLLKTVLVIILLNSTVQAQTNKTPSPCPPGMNPVYFVDTDNDGFASFDINYIKTQMVPKALKSYYKNDVNNFVFTVYDSNRQLIANYHTNLTTFPTDWIEFEYMYAANDPLVLVDPNTYCPLRLTYDLYPVRYNGDEDKDGILNIDEDTNKNLNLMDDDEDKDGIINLFDISTLATDSFLQEIQNSIPNPITQDYLDFSKFKNIEEVTLYDLTGKITLTLKDFKTVTPLVNIKKGVYIMKIKAVNQTLTQKLIIQEQ